MTDNAAPNDVTPTRAELRHLRECSPTCSAVFFVLALADDPLSTTEIARQSGCPNRTVRQAVQRLCAVGLAEEVTALDSPAVPKYVISRAEGAGQ